MATFIRLARLTPEAMGSSAVEPLIAVGSGGNELIVHAGNGAARSLFSVSPGGMSFQGHADPGTGAEPYTTLAAGGLTYAVESDELSLLPSGGVAGNGLALFANSSGLAGDRVVLARATVTDDDYIVAALPGRSGLYTLASDVGGGFAQVAFSADKTDRYLADPATLASVELDGVVYLLAASSTEAGLSVFQITGSGKLKHRGSAGAEDGIGIAGASVLCVAETGGETFALLGAAGSGTISVFRLDPGGVPVLSDHVTDDLSTRFGRLSALDTHTIDGFTYAVAGGGDAGLTLFALTPGGRLVHLDTVIDTADTGIGRVSGLHMADVGGILQVFATSQTEDGLTQFQVETGTHGAVLAGLATDDSLTGAGDVDWIDGGAGDDLLRGFGDADILLDGPGQDTLTGGNGADVFVLASDGETDRITDFRPGTDRIDLSAWPMLYTTDQIEVEETATGAILRYRAETLILETAGGEGISYEDVLATDMLGLVQRAQPDGPPEPDLLVVSGSAADETLRGTEEDDLLLALAGQDTLEALEGDDRLSGGGGADVLDGGQGQDAASYLDALARVVASLEDPVANTGDAAGDSYLSIEGLVGSDFADTLTGNDLDNLLQGDRGADTLRGRAGADTVFGGEGNDLIDGEEGEDRLDGGADNDTLSGASGTDSLLGGDGDDALDGGTGDDTLRGGNGADSLLGGSAWDVLYGDDGADDLRGGTGIDTLFGGDGDDVLFGNTGNDEMWGGRGEDYLSGGDGKDTILGGADDDRVIGRLGDDTIEGGSGDDRLDGSEGSDLLRGDSGDDLLIGGTGPDEIRGGDDNDELRGDSAEDMLLGDDGDDLLKGGTGADLLEGGDGDDALFGNTGVDVLKGGFGWDTLSGGDGDDSLSGDGGADDMTGFSGWDTLSGGHGDDTLRGSQGDDLLMGDGDDDELSGGTGVDHLYGGDGRDVLYGNQGADHLFGEPGADTLFGATGDDNLRGNGGNDLLQGGQGNDTLNGGGDDDVLRGGTHSDVFHYSGSSGRDVIEDFSLVEDRLEIDDSNWSGVLNAQEVLNQFALQQGSDLLIDFGGGNEILLQDLSDISALAASIDIV